MPTARIEHVSLLSVSEKGGIPQRITSKCRVTGLTDKTFAALSTALSTSGVPDYGDTLAGFPDLILTEREATVVEDDPATVDVKLTYEKLQNNFENQDLDDPPLGVVIGEVRANVQQSTTNLDKDGNTISVSHTYPADDPDYPSETVTQGGVIDFMQPARTVTLRGFLETATPWNIANRLIGAVNKESWGGQGAHEWMCTGVSWELHSIADGQYKMSFEFQHNPDSWNPTAVFIDERTNRPPENLVDGTGIKTIRRHPEVDFDSILGFRSQA